jgi:alpha-glucosidase
VSQRREWGALVVEVDDRGVVTIRRDTEALWTLDPRGAVTAASVRRVAIGRRIAWEVFRERGTVRWRSERLAMARLNGNRAEFDYVDAAGRPVATLRLLRQDDHHITWRVEARPPGANRVGLTWSNPHGDRIYGLGIYGAGPEIRNARLAGWAEEGPVGWGPLSPWLRWTGRVPFPRPFATYAPIPCWLSPRGHGGWITNGERLQWDIRGCRRTVVAWHPVLTGALLVGDGMADVLKRQRAALGRPPKVPAWVFGLWVDAVRGETEVREVLRTLQGAHVPATAVWVEDWMGSWEDARRFWMRPLSHQWDTTLYPALPELAAELHQAGMRLLGYFCPEVAEGTDLYREAEANGHLVTDAAGKPVVVEILGHRHGELDLTRPETRAWVADRLLGPAQALGFDGWMADFGEHLPVESCLADGTDGWTTHNRYPLLWQQTHRAFWENRRPDGDWVFFVRSAGLGSAAVAPVLWGGDSDTDWDPADGLASVVPQAIAAGLLGHAFYATDIGGYMTFGLTRPSTRELYLRWAELGALLPVMRTHHGTARPRNWNWRRDADTLRLFARLARLHMLLYPYLGALAEEAAETGLPLVRPLFLHDPDPTGYDLRDEYLLGPNVLVAPALKPKIRSRRVYFPQGRWISWWTGDALTGPGWQEVPAPLGRPPLFVRSGTVLPLAEGRPVAAGSGDWPAPAGFVDSLVPEGPAATWQGLHAATRWVSLWFVGEPAADGRVRLPGGREIAFRRAAGAVAAPEAWVGEPRWSDHCPTWSVPSPMVRLEGGAPVTVAVGGTALRLQGPDADMLEVTLRA